MKAIRVLTVVTAILALGLGGLWLYSYFSQQQPPITPPATEHSSVLIDLSHPEEGVISLSWPETRTGVDDFMIVADAINDAVQILDSYYIPHADPTSIKPLREANRVTVSLEFFAKNRQEFIWPESVFVSTWVPMWKSTDLSLVLPDGYEIVNVEATGLASEPTQTFENNRWKITTRTKESVAYMMKITYKKST